MVLANILNKALSLRSTEEEEWLKLARKRADELKNALVKPRSWKEIRAAITKR